jgi:hypothetical protein
MDSITQWVHSLDARSLGAGAAVIMILTGALAYVSYWLGLHSRVPLPKGDGDPLRTGPKRIEPNWFLGAVLLVLAILGAGMTGHASAPVLNADLRLAMHGVLALVALIGLRYFLTIVAPSFTWWKANCAEGTGRMVVGLPALAGAIVAWGCVHNYWERLGVGLGYGLVFGILVLVGLPALVLVINGAAVYGKTGGRNWW